MKNSKVKYLGAAILGVLLVGLAGPSVARSIGKLYGNGLHIEAEPRSSTVNLASGSEDAFIDGDTEIAGKLVKTPPASQTVAAGFTITADACGGVKLVSAASDVTSDTTDTFTAPAAANKGCGMLVKNTGTPQVILDFNAKFPAGDGAAASLRLAKGGSVWVYSDGTTWHFGPWTEY